MCESVWWQYVLMSLGGLMALGLTIGLFACIHEEYERSSRYKRSVEGFFQDHKESNIFGGSIYSQNEIVAKLKYLEDRIELLELDKAARNSVFNKPKKK